MIATVEILNRQAEQRAKERQWEEDRDRRMQEWELDRESRADRRDKQARRTTMASAIINAIIAGGLGLLAVYISMRAQHPNSDSPSPPAKTAKSN